MRNYAITALLLTILLPFSVFSGPKNDTQAFENKVRDTLRASLTKLYTRNLNWAYGWDNRKCIQCSSDTKKRIDQELSIVNQWTRARTSEQSREELLPEFKNIVAQLDRWFKSDEFKSQFTDPEFVSYWEDILKGNDFLNYIDGENETIREELEKKIKTQTKQKKSINMQSSLEEYNFNGEFSIPALQMYSHDRTRSAVILSASGFKGAIPLLKANLISEKSPLARMSAVMALIQLGDKSFVSSSLKLLKDAPLKNWTLDAGGGDALPFTLNKFPYSDFGSRSFSLLNPYTAALLSLTEASLTERQMEQFKQVIYKHLLEFLGYKWEVDILGKRTLVAMPDHTWLRNIDSDSPSFLLESLCITIDLIDYKEVYGSLEEIFLSLGHITPHNAEDNAFLPPIHQLVITMYRLNPKAALKAINIKLKEIDQSMQDYTSERNYDFLNPIDLQSRFRYLDDHINQAIELIAPEELKNLQRVREYWTHLDGRVDYDRRKKLSERTADILPFPSRANKNCEDTLD